MIVDKAVYVDGVRHECGDPAEELDRLRRQDPPIGPIVPNPTTVEESPDDPLGTQGQDEGKGARVVSIKSSAKRRTVRNAFLWVGMKNPTRAEFSELAEDLDLHPLAVEDIMSNDGCAKVDFYGETIVVVMKTLRYVEKTTDVEVGQLTLIVGPHYVLTIRHGDFNPLDGARRRLEAAPEMLAHGAVAVLHGVVDTVVDQYVAAEDQLYQYVASIERSVFSDEIRKTQARMDRDTRDIYRLKREVTEFRRAASSLVEPVQILVSGESRFPVSPRMLPFFSDVLDHLLHVIELVDTYDVTLSDLLAAHQTQMSAQRNVDVRRIAAWAALAAIPILVAVVFGLSFLAIPAAVWSYVALGALALIVAVDVVLFRKLKRAKWL